MERKFLRVMDMFATLLVTLYFMSLQGLGFMPYSVGHTSRVMKRII